MLFTGLSSEPDILGHGQVFLFTSSDRNDWVFNGATPSVDTALSLTRACPLSLPAGSGKGPPCGLASRPAGVSLVVCVIVCVCVAGVRARM